MKNKNPKHDSTVRAAVVNNKNPEQNSTEQVYYCDLCSKERIIKDELKQSFEDYENKKNIKTHDTVEELFESLEEEPKSIWKSIRELPECDQTLIVELRNDSKIMIGYFCYGNGKFSHAFNHAFNSEIKLLEEVNRYCTLDDFVFEHESLKSRIELLEKSWSKK